MSGRTINQILQEFAEKKQQKKLETGQNILLGLKEAVMVFYEHLSFTNLQVGFGDYHIRAGIFPEQTFCCTHCSKEIRSELAVAIYASERASERITECYTFHKSCLLNSFLEPEMSGKYGEEREQRKIGKLNFAPFAYSIFFGGEMDMRSDRPTPQYLLIKQYTSVAPNRYKQLRTIAVKFSEFLKLYAKHNQN